LITLLDLGVSEDAVGSTPDRDDDGDAGGDVAEGLRTRGL
jgi:hypothetical protein